MPAVGFVFSGKVWRARIKPGSLDQTCIHTYIHTYVYIVVINNLLF